MELVWSMTCFAAAMSDRFEDKPLLNMDANWPMLASLRREIDVSIFEKIFSRAGAPEVPEKLEAVPPAEAAVPAPAVPPPEPERVPDSPIRYD